MNFRSMYDKIFKGTTNDTANKPVPTQRLIQLNDWRNTYFTRDIGVNITYNTCIATIARHVAKLRLVHVSRDRETGRSTPADSSLQQLLELRPNPIMSAYDFLYKVTTQLLLNNNAYVTIQRDTAGNIVSLWPQEYTTVESREADGNIFLLFTLANGMRQTVSYDNVIHLRYNYTQGELVAGDTNNTITDDLQLLDTLKQSFSNSAQNSGGIRGVAKIEGVTGGKQYDKTAAGINKQVRDNNGIVCFDSTIQEFTAVNGNPTPADHSQLDFIRSEIYRYFGISEKIISNTYTEQEWQAFYESTVKPIALIITQEFTAKLFTQRELGFGNAVVFDSNRLEYADTKTKIELIKELRPLGVLTTNQALEIMGLPPVSDGDDRIQSLNNASIDIVKQYQTAKAGAKPENNTPDE